MKDKQLSAVGDKQEKSAAGDKNKRVRLLESEDHDRQKKSAAGEKKQRARLLEREDHDRQKRARPDEDKARASRWDELDLSQLGWLRSISSVFESGSKLWRVIGARCRWGPGTIVAVGEEVFCELCFDDVQTEASQKRHFSFWTSQMKEFLADLWRLLQFPL